jgi:hypothetical protein
MNSLDVLLSVLVQFSNIMLYFYLNQWQRYLSMKYLLCSSQYESYHKSFKQFINVSLHYLRRHEVTCHIKSTQYKDCTFFHCPPVTVNRWVCYLTNNKSKTKCKRKNINYKSSPLFVILIYYYCPRHFEGKTKW